MRSVSGMNEKEGIFYRKLSRREALSTAAKVAVGAVVAGVIAGVGGYYAGSLTAAPKP
jgi:phage shock protein PspC (stress-responsive transcriptional regulator)